MTKEEQNRIAVRAMAVTTFNAPIRKGETRDQATDAIVAAMEGTWPVEAREIKKTYEGREEHPSVEIAPEFG